MLAQTTRSRSGRWFSLAATGCVLLGIIVLRSVLAQLGNPPRLNEIFSILALAGAALLVLRDWRNLQRADWLVALGSGALIGVLMTQASLFSAYPFLGFDSPLAQSLFRGGSTTLALLGGLLIMRRGGPLRLSSVQRSWLHGLGSLGLGLLLGAPLALLNMYALSWSAGRPFAWQSPLAAILDALQPALVEEVVYRFALLGLCWLLLHPSWQQQAAWLAGLLALLAHTFMHFDELLATQPLLALGMALLIGTIWGLPPTILALRRDLEAAIGFHWIQDVSRFWAGF